jgi:hypothetical protein
MYSYAENPGNVALAQVANADALSDKIRADMLREIAENHARDLDGIPNEERDGSLEGCQRFSHSVDIPLLGIAMAMQSSSILGNAIDISRA